MIGEAITQVIESRKEVGKDDANYDKFVKDAQQKTDAEKKRLKALHGGRPGDVDILDGMDDIKPAQDGHRKGGVDQVDSVHKTTDRVKNKLRKDPKSCK